MKTLKNDLNDTSTQTARDIQAIRSRVVNKAFIYLACLAPLALFLSLIRIKESGWQPVYLLHILLATLGLLCAIFRNRLSYRFKAYFILGILLVGGAAGLPAFGLVGGAIAVLIVFAFMAALFLGLRAGLIACAIDAVIILITAAAVCNGYVTFSIDISEYAMSVTGWTTMLIVFAVYIPAAVLAFGIIHEHLTASLRNTRQVFNTTMDAIFIHDAATGQILDVNETMLQMYGYTHQEVLKLTVEDVSSGVHPYTQQEATENIQTAIEKGVYVFPWQAKKKDGSLFWVEVALSSTEIGGKGRVLAAVRDITERLKAEEELRQKDKTIRALIDNSQDWIWEIDTEGIHQFCSPAMEKILGYKPEEFMGHSSLDYMHEEDRKLIEKNLSDWVTRKQGWRNLILRWRHKDGSYRYLESNAVPMLDPQGNLIGFQGVDRDITEREKAEAEREALLKTLEYKNKELQSIVYISSHDLRRPLLNIAGFSGEMIHSCRKIQKLLEDVQLDEDKAQQLKHIFNRDIPEFTHFINAGTNKMHTLLDGLLRVSQIGTVVVNVEQLDMNAILGQIVETIRFKPKKHHITITVEPVPDCFGDEMLVNQVFSNLLDNAIKYVDLRRSGEISISGSRNGRMSEYCVGDNGIGIEPKFTKKIFEIFYRLHPDRYARGEGLGLSIVTRSLERMNGHIRVESEHGQGSRFFVSLPAVAEKHTTYNNDGLL